MFILKNALRCIGRAKGRNILIGIIALVIAVSACIGLSIRQASESAKEDALADLSVTATISFDRQSMMQDMKNPMEMGGGGFDRDQFKEMMSGSSSLTVDEYLVYAEAESVADFYYTLTTYMDGTEGFEPVSTDNDSDSDSDENEDTSDRNQGGRPSGMPGGMMPGGMFGNMASSGDFTIVGYSSDNAMTDFADGVTSISDGSVFEEGTEEYDCIISEELATYNEIEVGDEITLVNANSDTEEYTLTVVGIYASTESNNFSASMFGGGSDPANKIYMSAAAVDKKVAASEEISETVTDEDTGREYETALTKSISGTYVFADADSYYLFEEEVRELGLDESYTVSSADITSFENSLVPLDSLSTMAGGFLIVILIIGAVILAVLNIFNVRERKYEIGVLTAMGMKKGKVALQFMAEILVVTMIAVIIGAGIGAVSSVPVTNMLLENQIASNESESERLENNFGRPGNFGGMGDMGDMGGFGGFGGAPGMPEDIPDDIEENNPFGDFFGGASDYITEIDSAMNLTVVFQMIGIGLLLTLFTSAVSVLFVMRYDPLKILANRD